MKTIAVLFCLIATSMVRSEDKDQKAICARDPPSIKDRYHIIKGDHRDMDAFPIQEIKYCDFKGNFVFFSEPGFQVDITLHQRFFKLSQNYRL